MSALPLAGGDEAERLLGVGVVDLQGQVSRPSSSRRFTRSA
jgi:hypothetical protein